MKIKQLVTIQLVLIILTMAVGAVLGGNTNDGVRAAHKALTFLATLVSFGVFGWGLKAKAPTMQTICALLTILFIFTAAAGGKKAKTDYDKGLMVMRVSALLSVASTTGTLAFLRKKD